MRLLRLFCFAALLVAVPCHGLAAELVDPGIIKTLPREAAFELHLVLDRIESQLRRGRRTEQQLGAELLALDRLIAHYAGADTETASTLTLVKALLYLRPLDQPEASIALLRQLAQDYPNSVAAVAVPEAIAKAEAQKRHQ